MAEMALTVCDVEGDVDARVGRGHREAFGVAEQQFSAAGLG